jgi:SAM-dependent methyltransferase
MAELLERLLRHKRAQATLPRPDSSTISYGWESITPTDISPAMTSAWQSPEIPARQRALVEQELNGMYHGNPPLVYRVLADSLKPFVQPGARVLEVGCASGYYLEVLEYMMGRQIAYTGVDYSEAMIALAKECYPRAAFFVADGACLPFGENHFEVVVSSSVLLHVTDYAQHVTEAARVASRLVIVHRTPICKNHPTQHFKKRAYGVETLELRFSEQELLTLCDTLGLSLVKRHEYDAHPERDEYEVTYVFRKPGNSA